MNDVGFFMHDYSSAAFLGQIFKSVLGVHVFLRKVAVLILESRVVHAKQFTKDLALDLLYELREGVSIDETPFLGVVAVEIEVERQSVRVREMPGKLLYAIDRRLLGQARVDVEPI